LTFITDLDDLIRYRHGDVKKLREIRDTVRHDNFITTDDKNYVESLITTHLKNQPLAKPSSPKQSDAKIKLQVKPTTSSSSKSDSASNFLSIKKIGMFGGVAAAIAIIVIAGFTVTNQTNTIDFVPSTATDPISVNVDQSTYQNADIISISGVSSSNAEPVELSIENTSGIKIWNEIINPKHGEFSTLVIAAGGGWENDGVYTLKVEQDDSVNKIEFKFVA
jgi:hypothetical protein